MSGTVMVGAAAVTGSALSLWWSVGGDRRLSRQVAKNLHAGLHATTDARQHALSVGVGERAVAPMVERMISRLRRLTPTGVVDRLNNRILVAGMSAEWPLDRTLSAKFVLGGIGAILGLLFLLAGNPLLTFYGLVMPPFLFFLPDIMLSSKGKARRRQIRIMLPDTLDQITVCVEAGLAFEAALVRSARTGGGPLADEIARTMQDIQLGVPRKEALRQLGDRSDVDELRHFVLALIQAEGYGVPIGQVLRVQAAELREKRRQEAEERAQKVSIKMLFPLVVCILPAVFIVILAPTIFRMIDTLGGANF